MANTDKGASFSEVLDALVKAYPESEIVLTVGKSGSYYGYKAIRLHEPIYDLPVADTTAAGDTFIGYFLTSRSVGHDNQMALRYACKASGLAVSRLGAMGSIPLASEVFS